MYQLIIENDHDSKTVFKAETREELLKKALNCRGLQVEDQIVSIEEDLVEGLEIFSPSNMNPG